ncbi:MAG: hypothetical protein DRJ52_09755 [Thermoprotei archaeon]|nr:MAG: hypothetical protein DRJ52_09755 [Thermoprotei archaeon]
MEVNVGRVIEAALIVVVLVTFTYQASLLVKSPRKYYVQNVEKAAAFYILNHQYDSESFIKFLSASTEDLYEVVEHYETGTRIAYRGQEPLGFFTIIFAYPYDSGNWTVVEVRVRG